MDDTGSTWLALVRLSRPKYLAMKVPPFLVGFLVSGRTETSYLWFGLAAIGMFLIVTSYGNTVSDRVEDRIDYPERTRLVTRVGERTLRVTAWAAGATFLVLVALMLIASHVAVYIALTWVLVLAMTVFYSFGPRFKTGKYASPMVVGADAAGHLLLGFGQIDPELPQVFTAAVVIWLFVVCLGGYKDLGNIEGDTAIGFRSLYWDMVRGRHPTVRVALIVMVPYVVVLGLVALGLLPERNLILLGLLPAAIALSVVMARAETAEEGEAVKEVGYLYLLLIVSTILFGLHPEPATLVIAASGVVWYLAIARWLHCDPPSLSVPVLLGLLGRRERRPASR